MPPKGPISRLFVTELFFMGGSCLWQEHRQLDVLCYYDLSPELPHTFLRLSMKQILPLCEITPYLLRVNIFNSLRDLSVPYSTKLGDLKIDT